MPTKNIQIRPVGDDDYGTVLHPETNTGVVIDKTTGKTIEQLLNGISNINALKETTNYYVDVTNGSDSPEKGGSPKTGAFKTIQYAINQLKKLNVGNITINIAAGTYNENVNITGLKVGTIEIKGEGNVNTKIQGINGIDCDSLIVNMLNLFGPCQVTSCRNLLITNVRSLFTGTGFALKTDNCKGKIYNTTISISGGTAFSIVNSEVYLEYIYGDGNKVGIESIASTVRKSNFNLTATTPSIVSAGGQVLG